MYLITSVLSSDALSDKALLDLYRRRWGVELFYRSLKQTFGRRKLRSASAENAAVELEWSLIGLWGMGLSAAVEIARAGTPLSRISLASVLKQIRRLMRDDLHPTPRGQTLCGLWRSSLTDDYRRRDKSSRNYPRKRQHELIGVPTVVAATPEQRRLARILRTALDRQKG